MMKRILLIYGIILGVITACQQNTASDAMQQQTYDYSISVEETAMGQPLTILSVQTGKTTERHFPGDTHAYLFVYETIYPIQEARPNTFPRVKMVPQDTLAVALTRYQADTIYALAHRVFNLPAQAPLRDSRKPPVFYQLHDTDPYILVRLRLAAYGGAYYECSGYREDNEAGYVLRDYLLRLKQRYLQHQ